MARISIIAFYAAMLAGCADRADVTDAPADRDRQIEVGGPSAAGSEPPALIADISPNASNDAANDAATGLSAAAGDAHKREELPIAPAVARYALSWSDDEDLCRAALDGLNRPAPSSGAAILEGYAGDQAARMLGVEDGVRWASAPSGERQFAIIDYFNDGAECRVIRTAGMLSGNQIIGLGIAAADGRIDLLSFGHAGVGQMDLPAIDRLHTKLTYSVADVFHTPSGYVTALAPLEDFDRTGTIFIISWRTKDNAAAPFNVADYYPHIDCIMKPDSE